MIVDYDRFTCQLINHLSEKHKTNFFTVEDVNVAINEIKEIASKEIDLSDNTLNTTFQSMAAEQLLNEICECADNVHDEWDRDNLKLLQYMCKKYESKVNCSRYNIFTRFYDVNRRCINSCRFGHSLSLYGSFQNIFRDKNSKNISMISYAIIQQKDSNNQEIIIYNRKNSLHDIISDIKNKTHGTVRLDDHQEIIDDIQYIIAEPRHVTLEKAVS